MKNTVVIFASKYGSTKRYAGWIAETLSCPLLERKQVRPQNLTEYDTIVYGGGLYAGGVNGISLLIRHYDLLRGKKLILFTCGIADPSDPDNIAHIRASLQKSMSPVLTEQLQVFHFRGALNYSKLGLVHKAMMAMLYKMILKKSPAELREEDKQMVETYGKVVDFTDQAAIAPLIEYVKGL